MAVTYGNGGAVISGAGVLAVAYPPSVAAGDLLILCCSTRTSYATPPAGWSVVEGSRATGGAGAAGPDSGVVYAAIYAKVADGTETGTLNVTTVSGTIRMLRYAKSAGTGWDARATSTPQPSGGSTTWGALMPDDPGFTAGDFVLAVSAVNTDAYTYSAQAISAPGVSVWGTVTERADNGTNQGDDSWLVMTEHPVTTGTSSGAATYSMTASGSAANAPAGATVLLRIRQSATLTTPNTLAWSFIEQTPYAGPPWVRLPSAGGSGLNGDSAAGASSPTAVSNYASFTTDDNLTNASDAQQIWTSGGGAIAGYVWVNSAMADSGVEYDNTAILRDSNADVGVSVIDAGGGSLFLRAFIYSSGYIKVDVAIPTATWFAFRMRWDGTNLGVTINNGTEVTAGAGATTIMTGTLIIGLGYTPGSFFEGRVRDLRAKAGDLNNTDYATYRTYLATAFSNAIAGSTSITLSQSGTVTGKTALTGSSSFALSQTGAVTGRGALVSATPQIRLTTTAAITGKTGSVGMSTLSLSASATANAKAPRSGTSTIRLTASAEIVVHLIVVASDTAEMWKLPRQRSEVNRYARGESEVQPALRVKTSV